MRAFVQGYFDGVTAASLSAANCAMPGLDQFARRYYSLLEVL